MVNISKFFGEHKNIKELAQTIAVILFYGIVIDVMVWCLANYVPTIEHVIGYGLLFYFIKYEGAAIIREYRKR